MQRTSFIWLLVLMIGMPGLHAQIRLDWSMNDAMFFTVNPAYSALAPALTAGLTHARKWQNLRSSPTQSVLGLLVPFTNERMGIGLNLFSEEEGPLNNNGVSFSYAYKMPLQKSGQDQLALGASLRLMHVAFDQDHLNAADHGDPLLSDIDGNRLVPPSFSIGFHYQTGTPQYGSPVQFVFAGSMSRFVPFQDRFNTLSFGRTLQWHGLIGLEIAASQRILITPSLLLSDIGQNVVNYGLRIKAGYSKLGWAMMQYSKAGFLTTQLGIILGAGFSTDDVIELSGSNSWNFGTLAGQIGNSLTFGLTYRKAVSHIR